MQNNSKITQDNSMDFTDLLNSLKDFSNAKDIRLYNNLKRVIYSYQFPFPAITFTKGSYLFRGRVHNPGEKYYKNIAELSNIKDQSKIESFGRANEREQSIFYCSDNEITASLEVSRIARLKNHRPDYETTTIGIWEVAEDLRIGLVPVKTEIIQLNNTANQLYQSYNELIKEFGIIGIKLPTNLLDFISDEFASDSDNQEVNYLISCAFANFMYETIGYDTHSGKETGIDGISYSSVKYKDKGMNFAIKADVLEQKKIKLISAYRRTTKRNGKNEYIEVDFNITDKINYTSGQISWT